MTNGKVHVLNNNNVAAYEVYYNIAGGGQPPVTGSIGPIPSDTVQNYYDFSVNIPNNNYNLISIQVNDAQAQTVLAVGAQAFTYEPGTTLPVTIAPIHQCYYVTNLGGGYAYGFENNTTTNVGVGGTTTAGLDMLCDLNTQSTGYLLENAAIQTATVAYMGNGTWVNYLTVPPSSSFQISSGASKAVALGSVAGQGNNYPVAVGDIYCVKILTGGYAWLQITGVSVANGVSFDFRPNTTQSFCGYEQSTTDAAGNCGNNNNNGTPIPTWVPLGPQGFNNAPVSYVSMAFDNSGNTYVAYQDNTQGFRATVQEYNGTSWVTVGNPGFSPGPVTYLSLQVNGSTPFVAFGDGSSTGLGKAMVMEYNAGWVTVGTPPDISNGAVSYISLAVNGSVTYVAYSDASLNQGVVEAFNGSTWSMLGASAFVTGGCPYTSMAVNPQNNYAYVAYSDGNVGGKANVVEYNGAWVTAGNADFSAGSASYISLGIDSSNSYYPYVVYSDAGNSGKATLMNYYNSVNWTTVGSPGFTPGTTTYNSLAFNSNGPFVAFSDGSNGNQASCMAYLNNSWVNVGNPDFSGGVANFICLGQGTNGIECAYQDGSHGTDATVMQFQ
jgi:hypothetical protein